jgi:hypothetical protein
MEHPVRGDLADPQLATAEDVHPARLLAAEPDPDTRAWVIVVIVREEQP